MNTISVGRVPVLTLWASVVAERLHFAHSEALSLGFALSRVGAMWPLIPAGLHDPTAPDAPTSRRIAPKGQVFNVELLGMVVPAIITAAGLRGLVDRQPCDPGQVEDYLANEFGTALPAALEALTALSKSLPPAVLASRSWRLYEAFRPAARARAVDEREVNTLDLSRIASLVKHTR